MFEDGNIRRDEEAEEEDGKFKFSRGNCKQ
jgi:hypothetical protein